MFRRAVGSLLARRFSPRATPRTAPPSCFSSRSTQTDLAIGYGLLDAYIFAACALAGGGGGLLIRHFTRGTGVDGSAAAGRLNHNVKFKKPDMKERFERWIVVNGKTYRDEEEKAMRFELFKAALESVESQLPPVEESGVLPGVSCFADFTDEETRGLLAFPDGIDETEYDEIVKSAWAKQQKAAAGKLNHNVKFKKPDMKERFERWIVVNGKTYRDEEEKAMWFELFKAALESVESQLPPVEESGVLLGVSCFTDFTDEEIRGLLAFPNGIDETEYDEIVKSAWAKQQKGETFTRRPDMKQGDTWATQCSA